VTFNSQGQTGAATITASVTSGGTTTSRSITIYVTNLSGYPSEMSLSLFPDLLYWTETGVEDSIKVTVTITDSSNIGIPGLRINLASTLGVLSIPDTTNNIGKTTTYLYPGDEVGVGVVTASITISGPDPGSTPPDTTCGPYGGGQLYSDRFGYFLHRTPGPDGGRIVPRSITDDGLQRTGTN